MSSDDLQDQESLAAYGAQSPGPIPSTSDDSTLSSASANIDRMLRVDSHPPHQAHTTASPIVGAPHPRRIVNGPVNGNLAFKGNESVSIYGEVVGTIKTSQKAAVVVHGNVNGTIRHDAATHLVVHGNMIGQLVHHNNGDVTVLGNLNGSISQNGSGKLLVTGSAEGNVEQLGEGVIEIHGKHRNGKVVFGKKAKKGSVKIGDVILGSGKY